MTEQEQINAYLKNNPLTKTQRKKDTIWLPHCVACGSRVNVTKKKPATTYAGSMNSVFTDKVDSFPKHEDEDLCPSCISKVRNFNGDQNNQFEIDNAFTSRVHVDVYTDHLDAEVLETENDYQGFGNYELMEGTGYVLGDKDEL